MLKVLSFLFIYTSLWSYSMSVLKNTLTPQDVINIKKGILKEAISLNNMDDVTTVALSFLATSKQDVYIGDKNLLLKESLSLLEKASLSGNLKASMFLMLNNVKNEPLSARKLSKSIILKNLYNPSLEYLAFQKTFITTYVALTLDHFSTNIEELNFALESLESLKLENSQINLYRAFLFKALDSDELADIYLNKACKNAKLRNVVNFCSTLEL